MQPVFKRLTMNVLSGRSGIMSIAELKDYVDFEIKRIYIVSNAHSATGAHCHLIEKELFIMAQGSCTAEIDRGDGTKEFSMKAPEDALYVGNIVWHSFKDFSKDAVLLALSSTNYDPSRSDYIENYSDFKAKLLEIKNVE